MRFARLPAVLPLGVLMLYAAGLTYTPIYLCDAEVLFALNAHAIATTARDVNGRLLPLYFQVYADMWFQPVIVYFTALFLKVLPLSEMAVRLPSVAIGVADVVLMYLVARRLFERQRAALLAAILLALTPAHFIHSRVAMDYLYPVPFILAWLLGLLIFLERRRLWMLFAATTVLGIGCYSYIASLVMMPVYLGLTWFVVSSTASRPRRWRTIAAAGFIWPLVVIAPWLLFHSGALAATSGRYQLSNLPSLAVSGAAAAGSRPAGDAAPVSAILADLRQATRFSGVTGRVSLYWYFFNPSYLFLIGGYANVINSTRRVGVFLLPLAFLIPIGLHRFVNVRRSPLDRLVVLGFLSAPLAACLVVPEPYAIDRELGILPFAILLATEGADFLMSAPRRSLRLAAVGLLMLVPLHFAFFCFDYFGDYRARSAFWFEGNRRGALEAVIAREPRDRPAAVYLSSDIPYIDAYWRFYTIKHGRLDLLPRTVYFEPDKLMPDSVPAGSLLVTNATDRSIEAQVKNGKLHVLAMIPEPSDPPMFAVFGR